MEILSTELKESNKLEEDRWLSHEEMGYQELALEVGTLCDGMKFMDEGPSSL